MSKLKTRKAVSSRFKFTKSGKILYRPMRQGHFHAKATGKARRKKTKLMVLSKSDARALKKYARYARKWGH
ncbi:MAG: hypothetical protein A3A80_02000 [Candidatus Terrybacteria bacterium RIFCSPLOWO2_01_FULL_44_24]|uniref:Large ribosomal subunit protein bL35 n=1 Tax=Candidatus Terrybacteria bacterium RIFCSPHIGHO2_01_FULL_43_35 TaxID=1802361 RepID=A0A1G2PE80_9BACT|nr:MAG: hypothetical protein A2828_01790 [Candidatus Terrybacteria bacterium RIFCSPHIGHO2_01_FULL_43_35]OHA50854.1 MAG: hypothetical protein A3A80_02000 [Candidatus Terrybacteria bacterium RIFCSPLOWO2_01_FULL_44_24]